MKLTKAKTRVYKLIKEFKQLKLELFGYDNFVILDDTDPKVRRYNTLYKMLYTLQSIKRIERIFGC